MMLRRMRDLIRVHVVVTGMVQGVGFRYFAVTRARGLGGVSGWVRNRRDGSVEVEAQGPRAVVDRFVDDLKVGPRWSRVDGVGVREIPVLEDRDAASSSFRVAADA